MQLSMLNRSVISRRHGGSALEMSDYGIVLELGQTRMFDRAAAILADPYVGRPFPGGGIEAEQISIRFDPA